MAYRISAARVQEAYLRMRPIYKDTPQYRSEGLSRMVSADLLLKVETLNPIGSFKGRGVFWWFHCRPGLKGMACASAGNLGQAAAWEGRLAGIPVHIFASESAHPEKIRAMRNLGALVHAQGRDFDEAKAHAERFAAAEGLPLLVDGRDVEISEGLGTLGLELLRHHADLERIYLPIGNGALINGTASWFRQNRSRTKVIGVCAAGAPSMQISFRNKRPSSTAAAATIADGIAVRTPVPEAVEDMLAVVDDVLLVDDGEIREAMRLLLDRERLLAEPSGAAALAGALKDRKSHPWKSACAVVTGSNLGAADFRALLSGEDGAPLAEPGSRS
jgi:threonine dehydratase